MKLRIRLLAILLVLGLVLTACAPAQTAAPTAEPSVPTTEPVTQPAEAVTEPAAEEYSEPIPEGYNQVVFYWTWDGSYENCDVWAWWGDVAGKGYLFHECEYGAKAIVNVPEGVEELGFIVRRDCSDPGGSAWGSATKDYEPDRFAPIEGKQTHVYLKSGDPVLYKSSDGGKTLDQAKKITMASMADGDQLLYRITPKASISDLAHVKVYKGDEQVEVTEISTLGKEASSGYIRLSEPLDITAAYRLEIQGYGEKAVIPMEIFDSQWFADNYHYEGTDLGAVTGGTATVFKVWAPTASKVVLNLFEAGDGVEAYKSVEMTPGGKGVWSHREECGHGTYYTYTVTTAVGTQEAVDPYAKAAGVNGNRGMVVDLSLTDPQGWSSEKLADPVDHYNEAIIWEVHVRDFSNTVEGTNYPGKYLAFTETGLVNEYGEPVGIDYLKNLGITHVHLLPVYDYATVDESDPNAPFNWGYDPKNYNVPEGSYSTDPYNGQVRIAEYKQMVAALHEAGIGVIMDVVYNHTYDGNSSFNKIVPYYYYRYTTAGANTSASGCGNDTASERYMFGKFMVESAAYWVEEYHLDGLRFDLMGLHDLATMQEVEAAVHGVNPNAILYGEGWTMGATIDGSPQADQRNIAQIVPTGDAIGGIAVFNDVVRDGLKGSVFDKSSRGYISGAGGTATAVIFGLKGGDAAGKGWRVKDGMVINYMSAHDNHTLWDKLTISVPDEDREQLLARNKLGAGIILLSRGTPFWQAGEELLRTKGGDENSYKSSDEVNNIDWSVLVPGSDEYEMMRYYQGLIALRKAYPILSDPSAGTLTAEELGSGVLMMTLEDGKGGALVALFNPHKTALPVILEGEWNLIASGDTAGTEVLSRESGSVTVPAITMLVLVNDALS